MTEQLLERIDRRELEALASQVAVAIVEQPSQDHAKGLEAIEEIDLDLLASAVAGITDPLGQLRAWLEEQLKAVAEWIVNALSNAIRTLCEGITRFMDWLVATLDSVGRTLSELASMFQRVVLEPIMDALEWLGKTLTTVGEAVQRLIDMIWETIARLPDMVVEAVGRIAAAVQEFFAAALETARNVVAQIVEAVARLPEIVGSVVQTIVERVTDFAAFVAEAIAGALRAVQDALARLGDLVARAVSTVVDAVSGLASQVAQVLANALTAAQRFLAELADAVARAVSTAIDTVTRIVAEAAARISDFISAVADAVARLPSMIADALQTVFTMVQQAVASLVAGVQQAVATVADLLARLPEAVLSALSQVAGFVTTVLDQVRAAVSAVVAAVQDAVATLPQLVAAALQEIGARIAALAEAIGAGLRQLASLVAEAVDAVRRAAEQAVAAVAEAVSAAAQQVLGFFDELSRRVTGFVQALVEQLSRLPSVVAEAVDALRDFITNLPRYAAAAVENVTEWIWEHLPDWVKRFLEEAPKAIENVANALSGFVNAIMKFPEWFPSWFEKHIAEPISEAIRELGKAFEALKDAANVIGTLLSQPLEFIKTIGEWVREGVEALWNALQAAAEWLVEALKGLAEWVVNAAKAATQFLVDLASKFVQTIYEVFVAKPAEEVAKAAREAAALVVAGGGKGEIEVVTSIWRKLVVPMVRLLIAPYALKGFARSFSDMRIKLELLGTGINFDFRPLEVVNYLASTLADLAHAYVSGVFIGLAFNMLEPVRWLIRPQTKEMYDELFIKAYGIEAFFEMPTVTQLRDIVRRAMTVVEDFRELVRGRAPEQFMKVYETVSKMFYIRGYPKWFIDYYLDLGKHFSMEITDRFGGKRVIPFSPLFEVPTHSEVVRMLMRDVFASPMEWARFVRIYGMSDDLAKMFYMLSFEYPSFTQLWEFFVRGISGMLWYTPPEFIKNWFAEDARWLGAGVPVEPYRLNYDYNALFKAIPFYLKWIQKSNFSWFRKGAKIKYGNVEITIDFDWTADSWMLWDIAADLPGKIDARWMAKWALFDLISVRAGVRTPRQGESVEPYPETPFVDLVTKVVEAAVASPIYMDLRPFSRLLVANGLHPAWVPITAVAEAINALSDERTLLRTGFINLFKEGFWDYRTIDTLLDGFFVASFAVEYFDPKEKRWKGGAINVPVKFLPAERRLLELRAAMDRALDILRDLVKELNRAYAEHIVVGFNEYVAHLEDGVEATNSWFAPLIKELTGKELRLRVDMAYWNAYSKVLEHYRAIYTMRRIRYWIGRIITWSVYRLAAEYVTPEDVRRIVDVFKEYGKLTSEEVEMIYTVTDMLVGIARREYIPTPSQLATIAEVVPEAVKLMEQVFEKRRVPEEWRPIWARYIEVKPIANDVRALLTAYRRAKVYGVELGDLEQKILDLARQAGWTDRELEILALRIRVEELIAEARELRRQYLPTPTMLATLSEYMVLPEDLIRKALEARRVPKEWIEIWLRYIRVRPIKADAKTLLSAYIRAMRYGVVTADEVKKFVRRLEEYGFTPTEIELIMKRVELEEAIIEARELRRAYLPTPMMLATLSEYVQVPAELVEKALEARRVPREWMELWLRYIRVRPLADEARMLATAFFKAKRYGVPLGNLEQVVLRILRELGFTEEELEIRELRATIEAMIDQWREAQREYIPTPMMLATIAEVVPEARRLMARVFEARRVPPEWRQVWAKYIELRPLMDELRRYVSNAVRLYAYFAVKEDELRKALERLVQLGYEEDEIKLIITNARMEAAYRAYRELVGDPDRLARLAEYSPSARRLAIAQVHKMIDALPVDPQTKEFIKRMWEEFVRVRPVYDEVRRYVTELISDYANGVIDRATLERELNELRQWGLDDYEIQFYLWLAEKRRMRYMARYGQGPAGGGFIGR